jgi:hypothetical protein
VAVYLNFLVHTKKADDSSSGTAVHPGNGLELRPSLHTSEASSRWCLHYRSGGEWVGHDETVGPVARRGTWPRTIGGCTIQAGVFNTTHTLLHPLRDRRFSSPAYNRQWGNASNNNSCSNQVQKTQISSGYAAALMANARSFYAAYQSGKSFQISKGHANATWNFSPRNRTHWAYCETQDMNCWYLDLSPCQPVGRNDADRGPNPRYETTPNSCGSRSYAFRLNNECVKSTGFRATCARRSDTE